MRSVTYLAYLLVGIVMMSCSNDFGDADKRPSEVQVYDIHGKVEKGPFISGSDISIQPMDENLQVLGSMFNTSISDNSGSFALGSREFTTPYAEFMANGYFFNEVTGELSSGTITLRALVDLSNSTTVNVNILTHLKYARIKNLVASGLEFNDANTLAQRELLEAFGLGAYSDTDVSSLSIVAGTDESAALITISSLLLIDRSEAELTEYLSRLSADFGSSGCFSTNTKEQIAKDKQALAKCLDEIKENIIARYDSLGMEVGVKELSRYVDWNEDGIAGNEVLRDGENVTIDIPTIEVPNEGGEFTINIDSPIAVYLEPQINTDDRVDISIGIEVPGGTRIGLIDNGGIYDVDDYDIVCESELDGGILHISVAMLESLYPKSKRIYLYDYIGGEVAYVELTQMGVAEDVSVSQAPMLGEVARILVEEIANNLFVGLRKYNKIEQFYNYNSLASLVDDYVYAGNGDIASAWTNLYKANASLLLLKRADEEQLNLYADYCNVISAICYSTLVYGWGDVPYINDYDTIEEVVGRGDISRESYQRILDDLKDNLLRAVANLPERKNEPLNDANGFFFASKDVARVLLANIYMYEGRYDDAQPLLQKVIDNGFYTLDSSTDFRPATTTDNSISIEDSTEVIFAMINRIDGSGTRANVTIYEAGVMPYITLSDVYLSLAECYYMQDDSTMAEQLLSDVVNAKSLDVSAEGTLLKIKDIRGRISLFSGTYFAFLKRTGMAQSICDIEEYQLLLPIPSQELHTNPSMTQNEGY